MFQSIATNPSSFIKFFCDQMNQLLLTSRFDHIRNKRNDLCYLLPMTKAQEMCLVCVSLHVSVSAPCPRDGTVLSPVGRRLCCRNTRRSALPLTCGLKCNRPVFCVSPSDSVGLFFFFSFFLRALFCFPNLAHALLVRRKASETQSGQETWECKLVEIADLLVDIWCRSKTETKILYQNWISLY